MLEQTLFLIKFMCQPMVKKVLQFLLENGFMITCERRIQFSPEFAAEFYKDKECDPDFADKVNSLSKGPVQAFVLSRENAVADLDCLISSNIWCDPFLMDQNFHTSENRAKAEREIHFIFPNFINEPIAVFGGEEIYENPTLTKDVIAGIFNIVEVCSCLKEPKAHLAEYLTSHNANIPKISHSCREPQAPPPKADDQESERSGKEMILKCSSSSSECCQVDSTSSSFTSTISCITCSSFSEPNNDSEVFIKSETLAPMDFKKCRKAKKALIKSAKSLLRPCPKPNVCCAKQ